MFGISGTELLIILFFGFLIFGPEKLPQMGKTVGRAIRQFREAADAANKKFKEEVADPFQEAVGPYKEQMEKTTKPLQEDINAINDTFNEAKSMITDPFKDMLKPQPEEKKAAGGVISGGIANDIVSEVTKTSSANDTSHADDADASRAADAPADAPRAANSHADVGTGFSPPADNPPADDPFADVFDDSPGEEKSRTKTTDTADAKPIPQSHGTVKKSLAASLYDLDDEKAGE